MIEVSGLSKRYRLGAIGSTSLREEVVRYWDRLRGVPHPDPKDFWALRDVSFAIPAGEIVGVVGRNGAGKSTLLKILSRITEPTTGRAVLRGRAASLLEVGTGFHPELTGRENVYLNGAILGMTRADVREKFDEIVAFAEVDKFIDTPVKRYSSGMYVRLAFAVAAHLEPEILIIDEVLAVGDAAFQKKCLGKMEDVAARQGRTVLFVSHNMVAVRSLCQSAILLEDGKLTHSGPVNDIVAAYISQQLFDQRENEWPDDVTAPGNESARVRSIRVAPADQTDSAMTMQTPIGVTTEFRVYPTRRRVTLTYHLLNEQGTVVLTTSLKSQVQQPGLYRTRFQVPGNLLNSGGYSLKLLIVEEGARVVFAAENMAGFTVTDNTARRPGWHGREPGIVQPPLRWELETIAEK